MTVQGTIINGVVVWDGGAQVPDGTRVRVDIEQFEYPHPMAPYDRDQEVALLRQSHEEVEAGNRGMPLAEFEEVFAREHGFQRVPRE